MNTRDKILFKCQEALHQHGYHQLRTDNEIKSLKITKGAFYHYFPSKPSLFKTLIEEKIKPQYLLPWLEILNAHSNQAEMLFHLLESYKQLEMKTIEKGDILCNLMQELANEEKELQEIVQQFLEDWVQILQKIILNGKAAGEFNSSADSRSIAFFIVSNLHGNLSIAKTKRSSETLTLTMNQFLKQLKQVLVSDTVNSNHYKVG